MLVGIYKQTAKDVMTKHIVSLRVQDTIHYALTLMAKNDLSAIPVVDPEGKCVGMITQCDIIAEARAKDVKDCERIVPQAVDLLCCGSVALEELTNERVEDMMSEKLVKVRPDDAVTDVADHMLDHGIHHIPVVGDDNTLLGIVSTMDILAGLRSPIETN